MARHLFPMTFLGLGALVLQACASQPQPLTISVPPPLSEPCPRSGNPEAVQTFGDLAVFSLRQEVDLATCEARRAALAELIGAHASVVTPERPWWRLW